MKKELQLTTNTEDAVYQDPFAYFKTTDDSLAMTISRSNGVFYEYLFSADGYIALEYMFVRNKNIIDAKITNVFTNTTILRFKVSELVCITKKLSLNGFIKKLNDNDIVFVNNLQVTQPEVDNLLTYNCSKMMSNDEFAEFIKDSTKGRHVLEELIENPQSRQEYVDKLIDTYVSVKSLRFLQTRVIKIYQYNELSIKLPKISCLEPITDRKRKIINERFKNAKPDLIKFFANRSYTLVVGK